MNYFSILKLALPEAILALGAMLILFIDLGIMRQEGRQQRRFMAAVVASVACAGAMFWLWNFHEDVSALNGMLEFNATSHLLRAALLGMTMMLTWLATHSDRTDHVGEYYAVLLLGSVGLMFLVGTADLLVIFVSLELASLSLYILAGFSKDSPDSAEAALKYFLFGGVSAAFLLFGFSLLYALSGQTNLHLIATALTGKALSPILIVGVLMILIGLGFKIAAVPFHFWAPDAYQGASGISAAVIASSSKVASFFVLLKIMSIGLPGFDGSLFRQQFAAGWKPAVAILALLSMLYGNIAALAQRNVKRLLAYSAIAHAGYALLAFLATDPAGRSALVFYVITYGLAVMGAFAVVTVVEENSGAAGLEDFAGLAQRSPWLGFALMVFLLSLGGIPPLSGFFGKFYVFAASLNTAAKPLGYFWFVVAALALSTISLYYYLQVLKQAYVAPQAEGVSAIKVAAPAAVGIVLLTLLVIVLGCMPSLILQVISGH
jgi:NADH-quinone oxidoreductase subunit N